MIHKQQTERKMSQQMRAVLAVISADTELQRVAGPHIDPEQDRIDWEPIFKYPWGSGHKTLLGWCYAIWRDESRPRISLFDGAINLDRPLQKAVLEGLMIRWNLKEKAVEFQTQQATIMEGA